MKNIHDGIHMHDPVSFFTRLKAKKQIINLMKTFGTSNVVSQRRNGSEIIMVDMYHSSANSTKRIS